MMYDAEETLVRHTRLCIILTILNFVVVGTIKSHASTNGTLSPTKVFRYCCLTKRARM